MRGQLPADHINDSVDTAEQKLSINFTKTKTKLCLSLHYNGGNTYLYYNGKRIDKFKADNQNIDFPTQFSLRNIFLKFSINESGDA